MRTRYFPVIVYMGLLLMLLFTASCGSSRRTARNLPEPGADGSSRKKDKALIEKYEKLIGEEIDAEKNLALFKSIDAWLGVPYKYASATKKGTDCSGLVYNLYLEAYNQKLPRSTDDQFKTIDKVKQKNLQQGHLVFFKIEKGKKVSHVGIYLGNYKFVHASTSKGVRIDDMRDAYYEKTYIGGGKPVF